MLAAGQEATGNGNSGIPPDFIWIFIIILLGFFLMLRSWKRVQRSQARNKLSVSERVAQAMPQDNAFQNQIGELMTELADLSRQINGQLDTRMAKLEILQHRADATIRTLENRIRQAGELKTNSATNNPAVTSNSSAGQTSPPPPGTAARPKSTLPQDADTTRILELARNGSTAVQIAQKLSRPTGEIELILALHKNSSDISA